MGQIFTRGFRLHREEEEEGAVKIEELLTLSCQGSTQITTDVFVDLAKLLTEVVFDPGTEGKGETALQRFQKYDLIKLITQGQ